MGPRVALPMHLPNAFTVVAGRQAGIERGRMRGHDLDRPFHGVRVQRGALDEFASRCEALLARSPEHVFFSHATAALIMGMPLPLSIQQDPVLHLAVADPLRPPQLVGVVSHQITVLGGGTRVSHGLRVTSPVHTWCLLAEQLSLADLVAVGDFLVTGRNPLAALGQLAAGVAASQGRRGSRKLAAALPLVRIGPRSRPESHARLLYGAAGLPEPELNGEIRTDAGLFVAMSDFLWRARRVANEYEGKHHQQQGQFRADIHRRERVEDIGWRLSRFTADDVYLRPAETVQRMASRLGIRLSAKQVSRAVRLAATFGR